MRKHSDDRTAKKAADLLKKYPCHLPVIVNAPRKHVLEGKAKFLVDRSMTMESFSDVIWKRMTSSVKAEVRSQAAIKFSVGFTPLGGCTQMQAAYDLFKASDNFLYVNLSIDGIEKCSEEQRGPSNAPAIRQRYGSISSENSRRWRSGSGSVSVKKALKDAGYDVKKMMDQHPEIAALVICEKQFGSDLPDLRKKRFCVHQSVKIWGQLRPCILAQLKEPEDRARLKDLIVLLIHNKPLDDDTTIEELFRKYKSPDGFLRVTYTMHGSEGLSAQRAVADESIASQPPKATQLEMEADAGQEQPDTDGSPGKDAPDITCSEDEQVDMAMDDAPECPSQGASTDDGANGGIGSSPSSSEPLGAIHLPDIDPENVDDIGLLVVESEPVQLSWFTADEFYDMENWTGQDKQEDGNTLRRQAQIEEMHSELKKKDLDLQEAAVQIESQQQEIRERTLTNEALEEQQATFLETQTALLEKEKLVELLQAELARLSIRNELLQSELADVKKRSSDEISQLKDSNEELRQTVATVQSRRPPDAAATQVAVATPQKGIDSTFTAKVLRGRAPFLGTEAKEDSVARGDVTGKKHDQVMGVRQVFQIAKVVAASDTIGEIPCCFCFTVVNDGTTTWPDTAVISRVEGDSLGMPLKTLGQLRPGEEEEVEIDLRLPSRHRGEVATCTWVIVDATTGSRFGPLLVFDVKWE